MIKALCYISSINTNTSKRDIDVLSKFVSKKNSIHNITGVLIIQNGHFFQIMEGEQIILENIFKKIELDKRHNGIIKLLDTKIDHRMFEGYASGNFSIIKDFSNLRKLKVYLDWVKEANIIDIDKLIILTNNFLHYSK